MKLTNTVIVGYRYRTYFPLRVKAFFPGLNHYAPLASFSDQARAGLSSPMFDIETANIAEEDSRMGLDEQGTQEVLDIMRTQRVK